MSATLGPMARAFRGFQPPPEEEEDFTDRLARNRPADMHTDPGIMAVLPDGADTDKAMEDIGGSFVTGSSPMMRAAEGIPSGQIVPGNIDLTNRPPVANPDGSVSTVRSITITDDSGHAILLPTVINQQVVSDDDAVASYRKTGQHLGIFNSEADADAYAQKLHEQEAQKYAPSPIGGGMGEGFHPIFSPDSEGFGARVPQDSMADSPRFLQEPGTGYQEPTSYESGRMKDAAEAAKRRDALTAKVLDLNEQIAERLRNGDLAGYKELDAIRNSLWEQQNQEHQKFYEILKAPVTRFQRRQEIERQVPETVDVIQRAIENRQRQGREEPQPEYRGEPMSMNMAPSVMVALQDAAAAGRGEDTILAHVSPKEMAILKALGGSGEINPATGLIEFDGAGETNPSYAPPSWRSASAWGPAAAGTPLLPGIAFDQNLGAYYRPGPDQASNPQFVQPWDAVDPNTPQGQAYFRDLQYGDPNSQFAPINPAQYWDIYKQSTSIGSELGGGAQVPFGMNNLTQFQATPGNPNFTIDANGYASLTGQGWQAFTKYIEDQKRAIAENARKNASGLSGFLGTTLGGLSMLALPLGIGGAATALGAIPAAGLSLGEAGIAGGAGAGAVAGGAGAGAGGGSLFLGGTTAESLGAGGGALGAIGGDLPLTAGASTGSLFGAGGALESLAGAGAAASSPSFLSSIFKGDISGAFANLGQWAIDNPMKAISGIASAVGLGSALFGGSGSTPQEQQLATLANQLAANGGLSQQAQQQLQGLTQQLQAGTLTQQGRDQMQTLLTQIQGGNISAANKAQLQQLSDSLRTGQVGAANNANISALSEALRTGTIGAAQKQQLQTLSDQLQSGQVGGANLQQVQALSDALRTGQITAPQMAQLQSLSNDLRAGRVGGAALDELRDLSDQYREGEIGKENRTNLAELSQSLREQGDAMRSYIMTGNLPPGVQQGINAAAEAAKVALRSKYASLGMTDSTTAAIDEAAVDQRAATQGVQIAQDLLGIGIQEGQVSAQIEQFLTNAAIQDADKSANIQQFLATNGLAQTQLATQIQQIMVNTNLSQTQMAAAMQEFLAGNKLSQAQLSANIKQSLIQTGLTEAQASIEAEKFLSQNQLGQTQLASQIQQLLTSTGMSEAQLAAQLAQNITQTGLNEAQLQATIQSAILASANQASGLSANIYNQLANQAIADDQALSSALANFSRSLAGGFGNGGQTIRLTTG